MKLRHRFAQAPPTAWRRHVLVSPGVTVEAFATLADRDDRGRYPSDHLPVVMRASV